MESLFNIQDNFKKNYNTSINFNIFTIELNKDYHKNLNTLKNQAKYQNQIFNFLGTFEDNLDSVLNKTTGFPSLYFVDPFGYTGLPMNKIINILSKQSHEVFINVMSYSLVRNLKINSSNEGLCNFFGIDNITQDLDEYIKKAVSTELISFNKDLYKLEDRIIAFYKSQLKAKFCGELYVLSKRIHSKINPNIYFHLVFASSNILGLEKMKESFVEFEIIKHDIEGNYINENPKICSLSMNMFDDFLDTNISFKYKDFLELLSKKFNNKTIKYKDLVVYFLENTPLPYKIEGGNCIYNFIKKLEKNKVYFKRSPGTISSLSKIDSIEVKINNLTQEVINHLLEIDSTKQLTLF